VTEYRLTEKAINDFEQIFEYGIENYRVLIVRILYSQDLKSLL
jgi:hypothetical protein